MKKHFTAAIFLATALSATQAAAHHGQEYDVSACGTDNATATLTVTTVGFYSGDLPEVRAILQDGFSTLMKDNKAEDLQKLDPAFINNLVQTFGARAGEIAEITDQPYIYLDFHHPRDKAAAVPGCAP